MPPLILWALGALGAAVAGRWLYGEAQRVNAVLHPDENQPVDEREAVQKLERDPATGIYKPK